MMGSAPPPAGPPGSAARALREGKVVRLLELAMSRKAPVAARYRGQAITLSPHVLGRRGDDLYVLIFGIATIGEATVPLRWRWVRVAELEDLRLQDGFWLTAPGERPAADFLDRILAEADGPPAEPEDELPIAEPVASPEDELPKADGAMTFPDDDLPTL